MEKSAVDRFQATVIQEVEILLRAGGFVKVQGRWVSADDLKADTQ